MKTNRYMHPTVELCRDCEGNGITYKFEPFDVLNQQPEEITCPTCEGSGRVVVSKKIEVTVEPFKKK